VTVPDLIDAPASGRLSEREWSILDFEADWQRRSGGRHDGGKEEAIRARLGLTPPRYYQLLGRAINTQAALAHDPMLVARLRRLQESQQEQSRSRLGGASGGDRH
jgi:hypothetical protein